MILRSGLEALIKLSTLAAEVNFLDSALNFRVAKLDCQRYFFWGIICYHTSCIDDMDFCDPGRENLSREDVEPAAEARCIIAEAVEVRECRQIPFPSRELVGQGWCRAAMDCLSCCLNKTPRVHFSNTKDRLTHLSRGSTTTVRVRKLGSYAY